MRLAKNLTSYLLVLLIILVPLRSVRADAAAQPDITSLGGIGPLRFQSTNVQMVYERVEMELLVSPGADPSAQPTNQVSVTAWFLMRNQGDADESMQVIFPLDNINDCVNGISDSTYSSPELYSSSYSYHIQSATFNVSVNGLPEQTTALTTPNLDTRPCDPPTMNWAGFNVSFPVGQDVLIRVNYTMASQDYQEIERVQYILETGSSWHGPIGRADIIFRFPYTVTTDNVIAPDVRNTGTTPGYSTLYDEIHWSFTNFEPTGKDNLVVAFLSPEIWKQIQSFQNAIQKNPQDVESWKNLIESYDGVGGGKVQQYPASYQYFKKTEQTFREAINANPRNASLNARYGIWLFFTSSDILQAPRMADVQPVFYYLNQAMALDPSDPDTKFLLGQLSGSVPDFAYTPPPTLPPTLTPSISLTPTPSATPTETLTPTETPSSTWTPTPTRTRIPSSRPSLTPTQSPTPAGTGVIQGNHQWVYGATVLVLLLLAGVGWFKWWKLRSNKNNP